MPERQKHDERLHQALLDWDPAARIDPKRSQQAVNELRRTLRRQRTTQGHGPSWNWAFAVATLVALCALGLLRSLSVDPLPATPSNLSEFSPSSTRPATALSDQAKEAVQMTLIASNGVRVYWSVPPSRSTEGALHD